MVWSQAWIIYHELSTINVPHELVSVAT